MASQLENLSFGNWNLPLRIQRRGNFFSDEGFEDSSRRHFESAAKDLLKEFDVCRNEDVFGSYRRLRDRQLCGTDKAAKIAEEEDKYKIVMDVEGFTDSDLTVKVSGPNALEVEGRQEIRDGGAFSSRSFKRRFSLPGLALLQDATSVLSSDNVLTVSIPKKVTEIKNESKASSNVSSSAKTKILSGESKKFEDSFQSKNLEQKIQENIQKVKDSSFLSDERSSILNEKKGANNLFDLKIVPRQSFFDDSYFENVRQSFQNSVDEMMAKVQRRVHSADDFGIFRKIRETKEENVQAVSITEDAKEHKIVLDVHGFSEGDLKVRAVSDYELVVEGCVEKKTEYTSCNHTFKRSFTLPSSVNIQKANSALSSEGILTIIVPKKTESIDFPIPVRSEAATTISNILKREQDKTNVASNKTSTTSNTKVVESVSKSEHYVPVVQEEKISNKQSFQHHSKINADSDDRQSATSLKTSFNLSDSFDKSVEMERRKCEELERRERVVPVNIVGSEKVSGFEETEQTSHSIRSQDSPHQSRSEIIKESEKLVSEAAKLIEESSNISKSRESKDSEHYIPVVVDTGLSSNDEQLHKTSTTHQRTTDISSTSQVPSKDVGSGWKSHVTDYDRKDSSLSRIVPITFRGSLYSDSVFDDTRKSFETKVEDALSGFNESTITKERSKTNEVQKTEQGTSLVKNGQTTSTVLDDAHSYKIVLDVFGFEESELKIRTSGVNEISIEGASEKSKEGSVSKHSFQRSFQLPEYVDLHRSSAALSSEGIITVTIPKMNQIILKTDELTPVTSNIRNELAKSKEVKTTLVIDSSGIVQEKREPVHVESASRTVKHRENSVASTTSSSTTSNQLGYVVPLSVDDASDTMSVSDTMSNAGSTLRSTSVLSDMLSPEVDSTQSRNLSTSTSQSSVLSQCQSQNKANVTGTNKEIKVHGTSLGENKLSNTSSAFSDNSRDIMSKTTSLFNLPIVPKGHFFDDIFFQDSRSVFESALRNTMNRFNRSSSFVDDLGFFNSLRQKKITGGGNQMATLSEDDQFNKIVLDVQGFDENNLKIKVLSENEIVVEGEAEEKSGCSISKKCFRKNFVFPGLVNFRNATSALSSDGILSIKIPKNI